MWFLENEIKFYKALQQIVDQRYLVPMSGSKDRLKDRVLERRIHGAMHATRVCLFVAILHQILKDLCPDTVNNDMAVLQARFQRTQSELLTITQIIALLHDNARKGEGQDEWEQESAA